MRSVLCVLAVAVAGCAPPGGGTRSGGAAASPGTREAPAAPGKSDPVRAPGGGPPPVQTGPETISAQYPWSLTDTQEGRWMSYAAAVGGATTRWSIKVVDRDARGWWIEEWTDGPSGAWGVLYCVRNDGRISKAWRATRSDKGWQPIRVVEGARPRHKPQGRESTEKLTIRAGEFACWRLDVTVIVPGQAITSTSWHSRDVWRLMWGDEQHGGLVASESGGVRTELEAKGEDAKKTFPLPAD